MACDNFIGISGCEIASGYAPPPPEQHTGAAEPPESGNLSPQDGPSITSEANPELAASSPLHRKDGDFWRRDKHSSRTPELILPILKDMVPGEDMEPMTILKFSKTKVSHLTIGFLLGLFMLSYAQHPELSSDLLRAQQAISTLHSLTHNPYNFAAQCSKSARNLETSCSEQQCCWRPRIGDRGRHSPPSFPPESSALCGMASQGAQRRSVHHQCQSQSLCWGVHSRLERILTTCCQSSTSQFQHAGW